MVMSYSPSGARRLGIIEKHKQNLSDEEHTMSGSEGRRRLGWWSRFIRWLFGIKSTSATVQQQSEPEPAQKVNCKVSAWGEYEQCAFVTSRTGVKTCTKTRKRSILTQPAHGGTRCPSLSESTYCDSCPSTCGDSKHVNDEECDDGNSESFILSLSLSLSPPYIQTHLLETVDNGDGCSASCRVESTHLCAGPETVSAPWKWTGKSTCRPRCGDGKVVGSESCDDGNTVDGDGCSSSCKLEPLFGCAGAKCNDGEAPTCQRIRRDYNKMLVLLAFEMCIPFSRNVMMDPTHLESFPHHIVSLPKVARRSRSIHRSRQRAKAIRDLRQLCSCSRRSVQQGLCTRHRWLPPLASLVPHPVRECTSRASSEVSVPHSSLLGLGRGGPCVHEQGWL